MIKNLLLTIFFTTLNINNTIDISNDYIDITGVNDFISFNVGFIDYYNTYTNYGDIQNQLNNEELEITINTGVMDFVFYPSSYYVYEHYIVYTLGETEQLTIYDDNTYLLYNGFQGTYDNFNDINYFLLYKDLEFSNYVLKSYIYSLTKETNYTLYNTINYNAPYNKTRSPYIVIDNNADLPRWDKTINLGYFISNGSIYTEMIMTYKRIDNASPTYFTNNQSTGLVGGEESIFIGAEGLYYASELIYYNRFTQLSTRVWLRNDYYFGEKYVIVNGGTWVNSNYRTFTILGDFVSLTEIEKADTLEVLGLFNDGEFSQVVPPSNDTTSVFDLLGSAFTSLGGILNINVFPGVTLGLLLCIPFFGLVLLFIVGLFKR